MVFIISRILANLSFKNDIYREYDSLKGVGTTLTNQEIEDIINSLD